MPPRPIFPPALGALALIIAIDLLAGVWLGIHHETAVEYFVGQVPLIGVAGILWAFLPKATKDQFGEWLQWWLMSRRLRLLLVGFLVALTAVTFFRVSLTVASLEGNVATTLYLAADQDGRPPADHVVLDSAAFNRLTAPVSFSRWSGPRGLSGWVYTPAAISKNVLRLRPWGPAELTYPQDFDSLVTIAVLPGSWLFTRIADSGHVVLRAADTPSDTVAAFSIDRLGGTMVSFHGGGTPSERDTLRWVSLLAFTPDSARASMVRRWAGKESRWVQARRPIRQGERLEWVLDIGSDATRSNQLVVHHVASDIYLAP